MLHEWVCGGISSLSRLDIVVWMCSLGGPLGRILSRTRILSSRCFRMLAHYGRRQDLSWLCNTAYVLQYRWCCLVRAKVAGSELGLSENEALQRLMPATGDDRMRS